MAHAAVRFRLTQMEEGWVQCDDCQGWVHQICGLFNKGNNKDDADFHCPACLEEGLQTGRRDQVGFWVNFQIDHCMHTSWT